MSEKRTCPSCGQTKSSSSFYKSLEDCRVCVTTRAKAPELRIPLDVKVEAWRQEKEVRKMLRAELKKIAKGRLKEKRKRKQIAARKAIMPEVPPGAPIVVDPAMKELAQRELSRRRLIEFVKEFHPRYKAGWVHHDICRRLEKFLADVAAGLSPRLMILMPPRHGKSQLASKLFPAWGLGHHPEFEIIAGSYNVSLALEFSREVRSVVKSDRFGVLFPKARIDPDVQGAETWKLLSRTGVGAGGYVAAGIGGPITGKGAHILIIDDPVKNAEEAESIDQRQKIWDWYRSAAYTRLAPGGGVLIIQTWWHDDDLAGRIQQAMKEDEEADQFEIVKYPAIAIEDEEFRAEGEALHPERYDETALARIKRTVGPRYWAALYQQDPVPDEGAYFTKDMMVYRNEGLDYNSMHLYQAWDFAISDKAQNDYNVGVTYAVDYEDNAHVVEIRRFKTKDASQIVDSVLGMYKSWRDRSELGVQLIGAEDGQIWRTMQTSLNKRMTELRIYPTFQVMKPLTDKQVRARPLQGRMQQKKVTFPASMNIDSPEIKELLRFPSGVHDDVVDAMAWGIHLVMGKSPPRRPPIMQNGKRRLTVAQKTAKLARRGGRTGHMAA